MILTAWSLAAAWHIAAAPADTFRLAEAVALARTANPMLQAARLNAEAAAQRVRSAGALPDLRLDLGLMNRMIVDPGSTMEPMTMNQVQVSQMLPWPGKLGSARERADRLANAASLDARDRERMLVAKVGTAYYQAAYLDRAIVIMARSRDLLRDILSVAQTMYGVGEALQQDVLQAQVAVARMTEDITAMGAERVGTAARLNALLGRPARDSVGELELSLSIGPTPPVDSLVALAERNRPALGAAAARIQAAEAALRGARREIYPDLMVGLQYGGRPQYADMASLMIGFSVPLWAGSRQLPMRREMVAMEAMSRAEALDLANETFATLTELAAMAERSRALSDLYASAILPQARAAVESALAAYRVGRVNFMSVVENQMTVNRYETERVRLIAAYHTALAEIAALTQPSEGAP